MKLKPILLTTLGLASLSLGAVGIAIPVLPTTPFVLLAAACFSASSKRLHGWLARSRFFGPYIEHYRTGQGVKASLKITSLIILWVGLGASMAIARAWWICLALGLVGAGVTVHLLLIKTAKA
ncbi:MAG: YbaN family protein [Oscillospiraceae bacterium]|jgi:uncharacterized membrane protein YbaN (DUF454 family)|nr:YbaN family protein [Oscillospiraceae bacterium]